MKSEGLRAEADHHDGGGMMLSAESTNRLDDV